MIKRGVGRRRPRDFGQLFNWFSSWFVYLREKHKQMQVMCWKQDSPPSPPCAAAHPSSFLPKAYFLHSPSSSCNDLQPNPLFLILRKTSTKTKQEYCRFLFVLHTFRPKNWSRSAKKTGSLHEDSVFSKANNSNNNNTNLRIAE